MKISITDFLITMRSSESFTSRRPVPQALQAGAENPRIEAGFLHNSGFACRNGDEASR